MKRRLPLSFNAEALCSLLYLLKVVPIIDCMKLIAKYRRPYLHLRILNKGLQPLVAVSAICRSHYAHFLNKWLQSLVGIRVRVCIASIVMMSLSACSISNTGQSTYSQKTPGDAVLLFKRDLDSNDVKAASRLLAHPNGRAYLAIEIYELRDEVARLQRVLGKSNVTALTYSDCSDRTCRVLIEINYLEKYLVQTSNIDGMWFITSIGESASQID